MTPTVKSERYGVLLRMGLFAVIAYLALNIFALACSFVLGPPGYVITAALSTFGAASVANAVSLRIFERGRLTDIGLGWNADSRRNLAIGLLGGIGAALLVLLAPILTQWADVEPVPDAKIQWGSLAFVSVVLLFGAVGEELLFRGYAFQALIPVLGPFGTILPAAVVFGVAHMNNRNVTPLAVANTMLWGVLLGYAFVRSGTLWLPIGLHFGWNWTLPLLGVNLSGFTMGVTGFTMHWKAGELWSGGAYGPEAGFLTTAVVLILFAYLLRAPIRMQDSIFLRDVERV